MPSLFSCLPLPEPPLFLLLLVHPVFLPQPSSSSSSPLLLCSHCKYSIKHLYRSPTPGITTFTSSGAISPDFTAVLKQSPTVYSFSASSSWSFLTTAHLFSHWRIIRSSETTFPPLDTTSYCYCRHFYSISGPWSVVVIPFTRAPFPSLLSPITTMIVVSIRALHRSFLCGAVLTRGE